MFVGVARVVLLIHSAYSLKEKRSVLSRIKDRVRAKFNVSIAEVGDNDVWNRAEIGIVMAGNDHSYINSVLDKVMAFIDDMNLAEVGETDLTIEHY